MYKNLINKEKSVANQYNFNKKTKKLRFRDYLHLHFLFAFFSVTVLLSKHISSIVPFTMLFYTDLVLLVLMIMGYAYQWQMILKKFPLVVAYSNKGVVILWVMFWSALVYNENIFWNNYIGAIVIIFGIWMVSKDD